MGPDARPCTTLTDVAGRYQQTANYFRVIVSLWTAAGWLLAAGGTLVGWLLVGQLREVEPGQVLQGLGSPITVAQALLTVVVLYAIGFCGKQIVATREVILALDERSVLCSAFEASMALADSADVRTELLKEFTRAVQCPLSSPFLPGKVAGDADIRSLATRLLGRRETAPTGD